MSQMSPGGLNSKLFQWVPFKGVVGKLGLIAIVIPTVALPTAAVVGKFMETLYWILAFEILVIIAIMVYGHLNPYTAMLEGPDLVKHHAQEIKAMQIRDNEIKGAGGIEVS
jgi:hypothetical protein